MNGYVLSSNPDRLQIDVVHGWLKSTYWCPDIRRDVLVKAIANSRVVGAYDGEQQVGFARLVTDSATFAWVCDVFVDEAYRGKGIARAMVRAFREMEDLQGLRRWLLATRTAQPVYLGIGFEIVPDGMFMQVRGEPSKWQEPDSLSGPTI